MNLTRRAALAGAASTLTGCGFHPLYAPTSRGGLASEELQAIYVSVMAERTGQLLRQALQRRFEGSGSGLQKRYELTGGLGISAEGIAIQPDSSITRYRYIGNAPWTLRMLNIEQTVLTGGNARAIDGVNINDQQYFALELEQGAAFRRIAENVADQITLDVASFLKKRAEAAA